MASWHFEQINRISCHIAKYFNGKMSQICIHHISLKVLLCPYLHSCVASTIYSNYLNHLNYARSYQIDIKGCICHINGSYKHNFILRSAHNICFQFLERVCFHFSKASETFVAAASNKKKSFMKKKIENQISMQKQKRPDSRLNVGHRKLLRKKLQ